MSDVIRLLTHYLKKYFSYIYPVADTFFDKYNKIYKNIFMVRVKKND